MMFSFRFPLWQYLNQSLFDPELPPVLNPHRYWQLYAVWHLENCLSNHRLEHCWSLDYYQFTERYRSFVDRHYLEEDTLAFIDHCWHLKSWWYCRYGSYCHLEELISDS